MSVGLPPSTNQHQVKLFVRVLSVNDSWNFLNVKLTVLRLNIAMANVSASRKVLHFVCVLLRS